MADGDPFAPFIPRRGRAVAYGAGVACLLLFTVIALLMPGGPNGYGPADRALLIGCGLLIAGLMARYASIRAVPDEEGITVRNLFLSRRIRWADIEEVRFGGGTPWVSLPLVDGDEVAVMAIQRADGVRSIGEASRLAGLVEAYRPPADESPYDR